MTLLLIEVPKNFYWDFEKNKVEVSHLTSVNHISALVISSGYKIYELFLRSAVLTNGKVNIHKQDKKSAQNVARKLYLLAQVYVIAE